MSEHSRPPNDDLDAHLDAYLDDQLTAEDRLAFEKQLASDPEAMRQLDTQREIDQRLRQRFCPPDKNVQDIEALIGSHEKHVVPTERGRWRLAALAAGALAACLLFLLAVQNWLPTSSLQPFFEPRPLVQLYREAVDSGFSPYYFCEDDERFALTFAKRQGVPLHLLELPKDRRMVGLSYLGGLSRQTTAILCYVQDQPVIVFVDRTEFDNQNMARVDHADHRVHRAELGDLVIYEVSPFAAPQILPHLQPDSGAQ